MLDTEASALASQIRRDPSRVAGLQQLPGGRNNAVYRLADTCIKVYRVDRRGRADREWAALSALERSGIGAVPAPLWRDTSTDPPILAMSFVPGMPIAGPVRTPATSEIEVLAALQSRLQSVPLDGLLAVNARGDNWRHYIRRLTEVWPDQLRSDETDLRSRQAQKLLQRWQDVNDARYATLTAPPVFSHGDSNLENWLISGSVLHVVDFEFAGYSDAAFDAADLIEHISARSVPDIAWEAVLPALGIARQDLPRFRAAQRTCALRWLAVLWRQRHTRCNEFHQQWDRVVNLFA